jgi:hypothetical protein
LYQRKRIAFIRNFEKIKVDYEKKPTQGAAGNTRTHFPKYIPGNP